jgi:hypothetical protein
MIASLSKRLFEKLRRKPYRDAYVAEHARTGVAYQIKAMREQRDMSQRALAKVMGKPQPVIARLEDPDYCKLTVQTLLDVASSFDVALLIQFVSYPEFLWRTRDVSEEALEVPSFGEKQFLPFAANSIVTVRNEPSETAAVIIGGSGVSDQFDFEITKLHPVGASINIGVH